MMAQRQTASVVVTDSDGRYLGILLQQQLLKRTDDEGIATIELPDSPSFDEHTSIWQAMQVMRGYLGEAVAVVDSVDGRYLGAVPEAVLIDAYLNASERIRREEHGN